MRNVVIAGVCVILMTSALMAADKNSIQPFTSHTDWAVKQQLKDNIRSNPASSDAYLHLGNYYYYGSNYPKAYEAFKQAVKLDPENDKALACMAEYYVTAQKYDLAVDNAKKALEINPDNTFAYMNLGDAYNAKGQAEQALEYYQMSLKLKHPRINELYNRIGNTYLVKNDLLKAKEYYQKALDLDPYYTMAKANLLLVESKLKQGSK